MLLILLSTLFVSGLADAKCLGDRIFISLKEGNVTVTHEYKFVHTMGVDGLVEVSTQQPDQLRRYGRMDRQEVDDNDVFNDNSAMGSVTTTSTKPPSTGNSGSPKAIAVQTHLVAIERELGTLIMPFEGLSRRFEFDDTIITCKYSRYGKNINIKCLDEGQEFVGANEEYAPPPNLNPLDFMRTISKRLKSKSNIVSGFR